MHIMQALVGCQKRSTKILTRSLHPIDGVGGMRGPFEGQRMLRRPLLTGCAPIVFNSRRRRFVPGVPR